MQLVFGRNPETPRDLLTDHPDLLKKQFVSTRQRCCTGGETSDECEKVLVPNVLLCDMVAVWRMIKGASIPSSERSR